MHGDTVYLSGITTDPLPSSQGVGREHNEEWNAWVDLADPPVRACVQATLVRPLLLVETMVIAAR